MDAFWASVEEQDNPGLRRKPAAACFKAAENTSGAIPSARKTCLISGSLKTSDMVMSVAITFLLHRSADEIYLIGVSSNVPLVTGESGTTSRSKWRTTPA
jgi:hypothetical protein